MTTHQQRPAGQATFYQQQAPAGYHPQQGYPGQQPPTSFPPPYQQGGQPQPPKKRRRWPWVLGALIVLIVIISAANSGGSNTSTPTTTPGVAAPAAPAASQSAASAPASAAAAAPTYTYKVTGSGSATVMYTGKGGQMSQSTQKLPWSKTVDRDQFLSFGMVSATAMNAKGPLTCTITDENGQLVGQNTADGGDFATVSCNSNGS